MTDGNPGGALLASVSRSFYLTIKALPRKLRGPIGLGYLLARATDTIADSSSAPVEVRLQQLQALRGMIESGMDRSGLDHLKKEIVPGDAAERELISRLGEALEWLESMPVLDRADIVDVLRKITRGQELDLLRFGNGEGIRALETPAELDEYTYLVAGCVGEFWTRLCFRHLPGFTKFTEIDMQTLGVNFGKGLQLVNILRDLPADLKAGRCYLPLAEFGLDLDAINRTPQLGRAVFESWLAQAVTHLDAAYRYIRAISNWRLRYACILPWHLGMRTLILLREKPPLENGDRVKVSRGEVRGVLVKALFWAVSNILLRTERDRLSRSFYCSSRK
ncbi:MAG: phytoene/squalene synthase family protein [Verrucomicrobiota bacterium]